MTGLDNGLYKCTVPAYGEKHDFDCGNKGVRKNMKTYCFTSALMAVALTACGCNGFGRKPELCSDGGMLAVRNRIVNFRESQHVDIKYAFYKTDQVQLISKSDLITPPDEIFSELMSFSQSPFVVGPGCDCSPDLTLVYDEAGQSAIVIFAWVDNRKIVYGEVVSAKVNPRGDYDVNLRSSDYYRVFDPKGRSILTLDSVSSTGLYDWSSKLIHERNSTFTERMEASLKSKPATQIP